MRRLSFTALCISVYLIYELWKTLLSNIEVHGSAECSHMEHMTLSDSVISYYITVCDRSPHHYIGNLEIYILLVIGRISNITGICQMLWFYTFVVPFEGFIFLQLCPRIHWIQSHFVIIIIGYIWATYVYFQSQCDTGYSIVKYIYPRWMYNSCIETRLTRQYTPVSLTNIFTDNLTIHYQRYLDRRGYPWGDSYPSTLHFHRRRYDAPDAPFYINAFHWYYQTGLPPGTL